VSRSYTPDGLPLTINAPSFNWGLTYNNRRLLTSETLSTPLGAYAFGYGINANGDRAAMVYPGGPTLQYAPEAFGRPTQITGYLSGISYHPDGQVAGDTTTNGVTSGLGYSMAQNARNLPAVMNYGNVVQDSYAYDANGNVSAITGSPATGGLASRSMAYDGLDRLTIANGIWGGGQFSYDALDNLRSSFIAGGATPRSLTHLYDPATNRLTGVSGTYNVGLAYDANGNLVNRAGQGFVFDIGNRISSATGVASYTYDGLGRRVWTQAASGRTILRIYSQSGRLLLTQDSAKGVTRHIHLGDKVVAANNTQTGIHWLHTDALGSPVATTGVGGVLLQRSQYEPYGQHAAGTNLDGIGFTGHVNDLDTGLVYIQQRYYDPVAGRFLSVDPVTTNAKDGSFFGRYHYANNNPFKFKDPDGRAFETACDIASLVLSVNEFRNNPSIGNAIGVAVDAAAAAIPGIPGGGGL
jgi:RHS repeat-associated protein